MSETETCHLCGERLPERRWWQMRRRTCRDEMACRERFVILFAAGKLSPPARPDGRWI